MFLSIFSFFLIAHKVALNHLIRGGSRIIISAILKDCEWANVRTMVLTGIFVYFGGVRKGKINY